MAHALHGPSRPATLLRWAAGIAVLVLLVLASSASAAVTPPGQPASGPGGSSTPHKGVQVISGGVGNDAWFLFLPTTPQPTSAPLSVVTHGYFEFDGYGMNEAFARHTALTGDVVIYTRYQTTATTPCPGPFSIAPCIDSEVAGIKGALAYLKVHPELPQPQLEKTSYFGFSFGGIITANIANQWQSLGLPQPRAIFLDDPEDSGLAGPGEPALDDSLAGIPSSTKIVCHSGADGAIQDAPDPLVDTCNAIFPKLGHIPAANKTLVSTSTDTHGTPALSSKHGVCAGPGSGFVVDSYDWGFCWRSWDALRSCARAAKDCQYALGDTPENRYIGTWSDGTPMIGLKIQTSGPIDPTVTPARQAAPDQAAAPTTDAPPTARVGALRRRGSRPQEIRGTATDDRGVAAVSVAVVRRANGRCAQLGAKGTFGRSARCAAPTRFLKAKGTTSWRLVLPRRLPAGTYRFSVRVRDSAGHVTTRSPRVLRAR